MNIVLAETNPVQSGQADMGRADTSTGAQFGHLMNQQLREDKQLTTNPEDSQVVENKELKMDSEETPDWLQGLSREMALEGIEINTTTETLAGSDLLLEGSSFVDFDGVAVEMVVDDVDLGDSLPLAGNALPPAAHQINVLTSQDVISRNKIAAVINPTGSLPVSAESAQAVQDVDDSLMSQILRPAQTTEAAILNKGENIVEKLQAGGINDFQLTNSMANSGSDTGSNLFRLPNQGANTTFSQTLLPQLDTMTLSNPRDQVALSSGLGDRIQWMVNQKLNSATIRMDPPSLGRLEVHIQLVDDITNVTINTQHAQTRDLIDNASVRLREYLQENGYVNVNVDVSQEQQQQAADQQQDKADFQRSEDNSVGSTTETIAADSSSRFYSSDSVVDYFA